MTQFRFFIALLLSMLASAALAAPSTATFMNVLTVCGAGLNINIDANLEGSITSIYEKEKTVGRATLDIVPLILDVIKTDAETRKSYQECITKLLADAQ